MIGNHFTFRDGELRRRKYKQRDADISARVQSMKDKQKAVDEWEEKKRLILRPLAYCAMLLIGLGGGALAYRYYYYFHA